MTAAPYEHPLIGLPPGGTRWEATPIFDELLKERNGAPPGAVITPAKVTANKAKRSGKNRSRTRKTS